MALDSTDQSCSSCCMMLYVKSWFAACVLIIDDGFVNPSPTNSLVNFSCWCFWLQDVTRLFAGCGDNLVHVWDISSGTHLVSIYCNAVMSVAEECISVTILRLLYDNTTVNSKLFCHFLCTNTGEHLPVEESLIPNYTLLPTFGFYLTGQHFQSYS